MFTQMEMDIIRYIARETIVSLKDLENYLSEKYNISIKTAYYHIKKLVDEGVIRYRRSKEKKIFVELSPSYIAFIAEIYSYLLKSNPDRVRYYEKIEKK